MFLAEIKGTHITQIPSLIDQYKSKIEFDNGTFDFNDIVDEKNTKHDYELDIRRLEYELKTWKELPGYFVGRNGSQYFTLISSNGTNEHRFTTRISHFNQFLRRIEGFQKKYSVQLSYSYTEIPTLNKYLVRIYDLNFI